MSELASIIEFYFSSGYQYNEILTLLELEHKSTLSLRTLHCFLRKKNLFRKRNQSTLNEGIVFIGEELKGSGSCIGYKAMHQRCVKAGLRINRSTCAVIMKAIDPEGVAARKRRSLKRRLYYSKGPNWVWHLDGYDKLKPYGFAIHGCIDGYSRRVLWLTVLSSNKDPNIVCRKFLDEIMSVGGVPRKVIADRGTENVHVASVQKFLRRNDNELSRGMDAAFQYGKSISNQRIEAFWSQLRRSCTDWWIRYFRQLVDTG